VPKFSEIGAALATGLGVMWALNKIEIGQFKITNNTGGDSDIEVMYMRIV